MSSRSACSDLHSEFQDSQDYIERLSLNNNKSVNNYNLCSIIWFYIYIQFLGKQFYFTL